MYCPKCGAQNVEKSKFCRGCGGDLSQVAMVLAGKPPVRAVAEKQIELQSQAIRGLVMGLGFMIVAAMAFFLSTRGLTVTLFAMAFGFVFLGAALSRFVHARGLKALDAADDQAALPSAQTEFAPPTRSIYQTDDLAPVSVTETTTRHLGE